MTKELLQEMKEHDERVIADHQKRVRQMLRACHTLEDEIERINNEIKGMKADFILKNRDYEIGQILKIEYPNGAKAEIRIVGFDFGLSPYNEMELEYKYQYTNKGKVANRRIHILPYSLAQKSIIDDITPESVCSRCGISGISAFLNGGTCSDCQEDIRKENRLLHI